MGKISQVLLESFRHQLSVERISVIDEFEFHNGTMFVIKNDGLCYFQIEELMRVCKFNVLVWNYDGVKRLHLRISHDE